MFYFFYCLFSHQCISQRLKEPPLRVIGTGITKENLYSRVVFHGGSGPPLDPPMNIVAACSPICSLHLFPLHINHFHAIATNVICFHIC